MKKSTKWAIIDDMAEKLGIDANNRRVWRQRHVPYRYRLPILRKAEECGIDLRDADFDQRYADTRNSAA